TVFEVPGISVRKCHGPAFPLILSNVFSASTGKPLYAPWRVLTRRMHATTPDGSTRDVDVRIGVLGFTPPPILHWDKRNLEGKVTVMGAVEAARKYVPEVRAAGADIVIAIVHGGINASPYTPTMENPAWYLAEVPGIDLMLLGHSHDIFPNPADAR